MQRTRRTRPGVILAGRPTAGGRCGILVTGDGTKAQAHRRQRHAEARAWRAQAAAEARDSGTL